MKRTILSTLGKPAEARFRSWGGSGVSCRSVYLNDGAPCAGHPRKRKHRCRGWDMH